MVRCGPASRRHLRVGAGAISLRVALVIGSTSELLGCVLMGGEVQKTVGKGVVSLECAKPKESVNAFETLMGLDREWPNLLDWLVRAHAQSRRPESGKDINLNPIFCKLKC